MTELNKLNGLVVQSLHSIRDNGDEEAIMRYSIELSPSTVFRVAYGNGPEKTTVVTGLVEGEYKAKLEQQIKSRPDEALKILQDVTSNFRLQYNRYLNSESFENDKRGKILPLVKTALDTAVANGYSAEAQKCLDELGRQVQIEQDLVTKSQSYGYTDSRSKLNFTGSDFSQKLNTFASVAFSKAKPEELVAVATKPEQVAPQMKNLTAEQKASQEAVLGELVEAVKTAKSREELIDKFKNGIPIKFNAKGEASYLQDGKWNFVLRPAGEDTIGASAMRVSKADFLDALNAKLAKVDANPEVVAASRKILDVVGKLPVGQRQQALADLSDNWNKAAAQETATLVASVAPPVAAKEPAVAPAIKAVPATVVARTSVPTAPTVFAKMVDPNEKQFSLKEKLEHLTDKFHNHKKDDDKALAGIYKTLGLKPAQKIDSSVHNNVSDADANRIKQAISKALRDDSLNQAELDNIKQTLDNSLQGMSAKHAGKQAAKANSPT